MHTPGPWKVGDIIRDKSYPYQELRTAVEAECLRAIIIETNGRPWIIATADAGSSSERDANARLIAASPMLLEALKFIVNDVPEPGEDARLTADGYNMACAAIAAAEGRE